MTELAVAVSYNNISPRTLTYGDRNAWAAYARRRWRTNTLCEIQAEWELSEGEARGLLYAHASQATIDKIKNHRNGGVMLALDFLCIRFGVTLEQLASRLEERASHERDDRAADAERWGRARRALEGRDRDVSEDRA